MSANRRNSSASYSLFSVRYGIFPIAQHAQAFELHALDVNVFAGVGFARFADGQRHRLTVSPALRMSWETLNSMGRPWQSQPGT